jgi:Skp family chaperone for outer membrane proteins
MEKSMAFKDEINSTMREARREMLKPLRDKIDEVLLQICVDEGFDHILNTDDHAYVAINPKRGKDVTDKVKKALNIEQ